MDGWIDGRIQQLNYWMDKWVDVLGMCRLTPSISCIQLCLWSHQKLCLRGHSEWVSGILIQATLSIPLRTKEAVVFNHYPKFLPLRQHVMARFNYKCWFFSLYKNHHNILIFTRQEALLAAISEKDANIALLELSASKKKKTQEEVMALKREKDRLVHQLKQQVGPFAWLVCFAGLWVWSAFSGFSYSLFCRVHPACSSRWNQVGEK